MSWDRMTKVVERYERLVGGELRELKKLQKDIIECPNLDSSSARRQAEQLEEQLLSGLQKLLSMRGELDEAGQELFDTRIEPIRRQIQVAVSMNKKLPEPKSPSGFFETTIEDEVNPYEMESRRYQQSIDEQSVQRRQLAEEAKAKAEATAKLAKDMKDLEEIFTELATIVHDQHDMVDSIEEHVERAVQDVQRGNEQLKKAVQHKTARAPVLAAVVGGLAVGGPVGVAAGSAIAGIAAGVGGLVAGIYTGKWFKNAVRRDLEPSPSSKMAVLIETTLGDLVVDLFVKERPNCSKNFLKLCKSKYYNLCQFHTIEENYVAQTGDPTGTGRGGESIYASIYGEQGRFFEKEDLPKMKHTRMGLVAFVNNGNDQLGSQFYITLGDNCDYLDQQHTIFGQVTEGLDTLEKLNDEICDEDHKPMRDIRIAHTIILEDPFEDPPRFRYPSRSPSPTFDQLVQVNKIALDQKVDEDEGKTAEELELEMKQREMTEQAQILEMVGDLKSADDAPPDNVLFVCKLNPVTQDDDLEIIFSRFGKISSCEIIRDRRTQQSLQYAFIEFEDPKSCERAFFKMDNVLIDDRRIHVDFSQSVAKSYKWNRGDKNEPEVKKERLSPLPQVKREVRSRSPERRRNYSPKRSRDHRDSRRDGRRDERRDRSPPRRDHREERHRRRSPSPKRRRSRSPKRSSHHHRR